MARSPPFLFKHLILLEAASWQGSNHSLLFLLFARHVVSASGVPRPSLVCDSLPIELVLGLLPRLIRLLTCGRHLGG